MEERELRYIQTIAELKSFTKAAEKLYLTQPTLSHLVSKVEKRVGVPLFDRSTTPLTLTYAGERYLRYAQQQLAAKEMLEREFRDICNVRKGRLRLGLPGDRASYLLPEIVPLFHAEYPEFDLQIEEGTRERLAMMLKRGQIDFALVPMIEEIDNAAVIHVGTEELLLVAAPGFFKPAQLIPGTPPKVRIEALRGQQFILQKQHHSIRSVLDVFFRKYDIQPKVLMELAGQISTYRLCAAGQGLAFLPNIIVAQAQGMNRAETFRVLGCGRMEWPVGLYYRQGSYIGAPETRLIEIIKAAFARLSEVKE